MKILNFILDIVFPKRCAMCGKNIEFASKEFACVKCMKKISKEEAKIIKHVGDNKFKYIEFSISVFTYEDGKKAVDLLKFKGLKGNSKYIAYIMYVKMFSSYKWVFERSNVITYVPIHKSKIRTRGFNQSEEIGKYLSDYSGIDHENLLIRTKRTKEQSKLKFKDRQENLKDVFKVVEKNKVKDKNIILIDDVFTTGATAKECSKTLMKAGAKAVYVLTFAQTLHESKGLVDKRQQK